MEREDSAGEGRRGFPFRWASALRLGLLFAMVVACYAPSLGNGFVYDDLQLIVRTPPPGSVSEVLGVFAEPHWPTLPYYRPIARFTMVVQQALHGGNAAPYHLFNAVAMAVTSLLAYALLRAPAFGIPVTLAWLGAALFALHPIASSTVHPICSGRETLLPALFAVASVAAFLRPGRRCYGLALVMFGAALLSKEQAIVVPGMLVLADVLGLSADGPGRRPGAWLRRHLPFLGLTGAYLVLRAFVLDGGNETKFVAGSYPSGPLRSFYFTFQTTLTPFVDLVYEPREPIWNAGWRRVVWPLLAVLGGVAVALQGSAVRARVVFWLGWIALSVALTSNFLHQQAPFAERYGFLALLGFVGIAAVLASTVWERPAARRAATSIGVVIVVACAAVSASRFRFYVDDLTFLEQWLRTDPLAGQVHLSLASHHDQAGNPETAAFHYRKALELGPRQRSAQRGLGALLLREGDLDGAAFHLEQAVRFFPKYALAHFDLGRLHLARSQPEDALAHLARAVSLEPQVWRAHHQLGLALLRLQRAEEARASFERALALAPRSVVVHQDLAAALTELGRHDEAAAHRGGAAKQGGGAP
jgi:Tfp pilus assembly protein PilF